MGTIRSRGTRRLVSALLVVVGLVGSSSYFASSALAGPIIAPPVIYSSPANSTPSTTASFAFSDSEYGVGYKCSIDGDPYVACSSGMARSGFSIGSHAFSVEAFTRNDKSRATTYRWTVNPPTPTITSGPSALSNDTTASFNFVDSLRNVSYRCSLDHRQFSSCWSGGVVYRDLSDGYHTFSVEAVYASRCGSTSATYSFRVDTQPPSVNLTFPSNLGVYATHNWTGQITGTAYDRLSPATGVFVAIKKNSTGDYWNGTGFSSTTADFLPAVGTTSWSYPFAQPPDGLYTLYVRATDALGNTTSWWRWATAVFLIHAVAPPAPVITTAPSNPSTDTYPQFRFVDRDWPNVSFYCRLDDGPIVKCTGDTEHNGDWRVEGEQQYFNLSRNFHCFSVYAVSRWGDKSPTTSYCWTITGTSLMPFTIGGNITPLLYPGSTQPLDLVFHNPNAEPITIAAGGVSIAISTTKAGCSTATNYAVTKGLTAVVTVPPDSTRSLSQLAINESNWPLISMIETHTNQDVCSGAPLTLTYRGSAR
jgi:large repetitive protein